MLEIEIARLAPVTVLFPAATPETAHSSATTWPAKVILRSPISERTRCGGLKIVWTVSWRPKDAITWTLLHQLEGDLQQGDFVFGRDEEYGQPMPEEDPGVWARWWQVDMVLPGDLPPSRDTPFERVVHTLSAAVIFPSPTYSVIPPLRPPSPAPSDIDPLLSVDSPISASGDTTPILSSLRRISLNLSSRRSSRSSIHSVPSSKGKGKDVQEMLDVDVNAEPPIPGALTPNIAMASCAMQVSPMLDAPGRCPSLEVRRRLSLPGLGMLNVNALSDMFVLGSGFLLCLLLTDLNSLATVHCIKVILTQRQRSPDGKTTHFNEYTLHQRGRTMQSIGKRYEVGDVVWRGEAARVSAKATSTSPSVPSQDTLHLVVAPRMPSPALGAQPARPPDVRMSSTEHTLTFMFYWSIYGVEAYGKPIYPPREGEMRTTSLDNHVRAGSCVLTSSNVEVPGYGAPTAPWPEWDKWLAPYKEEHLTRAMSSSLAPLSWTETEGRMSRRVAPELKREDAIRAHQMSTVGQCSCFFPDATPLPHEVGTGEFSTDSLRPREDELEVARAKVVREYRLRHPDDRKRLPGFMYMLYDQCACQSNLPAEESDKAR